MSRSVTLKKRENWLKFCTSNFMPKTPAQKLFQHSKAIRKRELRIKQRVEEQSRAAEAMARLGFDPGPMPSWVVENISKAFGGTSRAP
jgi:hypothetical protein